METNLPTPKNGRVYVILPEGIIKLSSVLPIRPLQVSAEARLAVRLPESEFTSRARNERCGGFGGMECRWSSGVKRCENGRKMGGDSIRIIYESLML